MVEFNPNCQMSNNGKIRNNEIADLFSPTRQVIGWNQYVIVFEAIHKITKHKITKNFRFGEMNIIIKLG